MEAEKAQEIFKALSDPNRLRIFDMLLDGELCACRLLEALDVTQPTLSHHMAILQRCGLVKGVKQGQWVHYSVDPETVSGLEEFFASARKRIRP